MPDTAHASNLSTSFNGIESLAYAQGRPSLSATLKQELSDFIVDEQLGFEPTGSGEHVYLWVEKTNLSTSDVAKKLSEVSGVAKSAIGYSGMKDRRGQTGQWFSVKIPASEEEALQRSESEFLQIVKMQRNSRKLKIGSHKANHFKILLRDCVGSRAEFEARLGQIQSRGIPNYFGAQRFGRDLSNLHQVQEWMDAELAREGGKGDGAISRAPIAKQRFKRSMLLSAARSYLFNQLLSNRVELGNWDSYVEGDVLNLDGTERSFAVSGSPGWDEILQQRLEDFDIHVTGPLPGALDSKDKYVSYGKAADIEDAVCKQFSNLVAGLAHFGVRSSRRPLRFRPMGLRWEWLENESAGQAGQLLLEFSLNKGCYATSLLRELCNCNEPGQ